MVFTQTNEVTFHTCEEGHLEDGLCYTAFPLPPALPTGSDFSAKKNNKKTKIKNPCCGSPLFVFGSSLIVLFIEMVCFLTKKNDRIAFGFI